MSAWVDVAGGPTPNGSRLPPSLPRRRHRVPKPAAHETMIDYTSALTFADVWHTTCVPMHDLPTAEVFR